MDTIFHRDAILREEIISRYLSRKLDSGLADSFESHYLACQDCFEEVRAAELLIYSLGRSAAIECARSRDVTVIRFSGAAELTSTSSVLADLEGVVQDRGDTKVLIDLSRVSRIDSAGLGALMSCYTHAVRNSGVLKLLRPNAQVKRVLSLTHLDTVVPAFEDETAALQSFQ